MLVCDVMLCCVPDGYILTCSPGIYFSDVVLTNYLAYGLLQVNMIWQKAVMPTQYDNNGATNFLTQLASSGLHSLSFEVLEILTSASWSNSCAQRRVLFQKCVQYCSSAGVRPGLACSSGGGWPGPCQRWCWSWAARHPCCGCITWRVPFRNSDGDMFTVQHCSMGYGGYLLRSLPEWMELLFVE